VNQASLLHRALTVRSLSILLGLAAIVGVDARGSVLDIQDLRPMSDEIHDAAAPASAAIEANQGWFQRNGVTSGTHVDLCLG
jgi:uncharacterized membrane protein (UPF0127 family)